MATKAEVIITAKDKTKRAFRGVEGGLKRIRNSLRSAAVSMAKFSGLAAIASIGGLAVLTKSLLEGIDQVGKMSDRIGTSTEALSQYRHVAELSGVAFNTLTMGWQRMTRRVSEAAQGFGEAKGALKELNLSAADLNKLKPEDQFELIADALFGLNNQADRVRLSMKLFDSEGVSLLQTMTAGAAGIRRMREEADELGLTLSRDNVDAAADANDAIQRFSASWKGMSEDIAIGLAGPMADSIDWFRNIFPKAVDKAILPANVLSEAIFNIWKGFNRSDITGGLDIGAEKLEQMKEKVKDMQFRYDDFVNSGETKRAEDELFLLNEQLDRIKKIEDIQNRMADFRAPPKPEPELIIITGGPPTKTLEQKGIEERLQRQLETLTTSLMTEEGRLFESLANRQFMVEDAFEFGLVSEQRHQELILQLQNNFETKLTAITLKGLSDRQKFEIMSAKLKTKTVVGEMVRMTQGVAQHSKSMFKINKAAGLANALISGYESFNKTMAAYPYPWNIGLASLGLAATGAQIKAIKSTQFGGGGSGTTPSAAGSIPTINDIPIPALTGSDTARPATQVDLTIVGGFHSAESVRELIEAINDEVGDGVHLNVTVAA